MEGKTPYEAMHGEKPKVGHLGVFVCTAYSHIPKDERQKLDPKTHKCIFLGYSTNRKGYRLYDESTHKVIHSSDAKFDESTHTVEKEFLPPVHSENLQVVIDCSSHERDSPEDASPKNGEKQEIDSNGNNTILEESLGPTAPRSQRETKRPDYYGERVFTATSIREPNSVGSEDP